MRHAYTGSTPRISAHFVQLRSTEPSDEIRMPSMSNRMPLQRIATGEESLYEAIVRLYRDQECHGQRFACVTAGATKLTLGCSPSVRAPWTARFRDPCCT